MAIKPNTRLSRYALKVPETEAHHEQCAKVSYAARYYDQGKGAYALYGVGL